MGEVRKAHIGLSEIDQDCEIYTGRSEETQFCHGLCVLSMYMRAVTTTFHNKTNNKQPNDPIEM